MSAAEDLRRGWCPTLLQPMESGDGWLARVKPTAATLTANEARILATLARTHGNGHLDLTSRGALQVRGLTADSLPRFTKAVLFRRLALKDPAAEARRSVLASPLAGDDPACRDIRDLAKTLEQALADSGLPLPSKFGMLLDGNGLVPMDGNQSDIALRAHGDGFRLDLGDTATSVQVAEQDAPRAVIALATALVASGARRMRDLVARDGIDKLLAAVGLHGTAIAAPALATPPTGFHPYAPPVIPAAAKRSAAESRDPGSQARSTEASPLGPGSSSLRSSPGMTSEKNTGSQGVFAAVAPFGRLHANALEVLGNLAEGLGDGSLRFGQARRIYLTAIKASDLATIETVLADTSLVTRPRDLRLSIAACPGAPACRSGAMPASADAARLAAGLTELPASLHVSGCAKGCAHPEPAALTLTGREGRYDLVLDGRAGDTPVVRGLTLEQAIAHLTQKAGHA